ncbi:hypothetical protein [Pseudoalteromonas sp.]|uniref:hypothetical protein n=1 Tax=Pseudoalteromonas sp. TaxID=53249 RepID=UPI0035637D4D
MDDKSFKELYLGSFTVDSSYSKAVDCLVDYYEKTENLNNKNAREYWREMKNYIFNSLELDSQSFQSAKQEALNRVI